VGKQKAIVKSGDDLPVELLAKEIEKISKAMEALKKSCRAFSMIVTFNVV